MREPGSSESMQLPGFDIIRRLDRASEDDGERIYLGFQALRQKEVVIRTWQAGEQDVADILARIEAHPALSAEFRHPNLERIFEAGASGQTLYLVTDYATGGDLRQNLAAGRALPQLLDALGELAKALDFAHGLGVCHGRIRPGAVVFRPNSAPMLCEFCSLPHVWRAGGDAEGEASVRGDLRALGALLAYVLTGRLPTGSKPEALRDILARVPASSRPLRSVLERSLSQAAGQGYSKGADFAEALEAAVNGGRLSRISVRTAAVSNREIAAIEAASDLPALALAQTQRPRRRNLPWRWLAPAALLALGSGWLVLSQGWQEAVLIRFGLTEHPQLESALNYARSLQQDTGQNPATIIEAYRQALAFDSDHAGARQAIADVGEAWRRNVRGSLSRNELDLAAFALEDMAVIFPDDPERAELQRQLDNRRAADTLLASTQALVRIQGLSAAPSAAIQAYQEIVRLAPGHPQALRELTRLAEHYADLARAAARRRDVDEAITYLQRATTADAELAVFDEVRQEIQQATEARATLDDLLRRAGDLRAVGRLVHPPGANAAELYHRVLATSPDSSIAQQGLNEVTSQLLAEASLQVSAGNLEAVESLLDQASAAGISANALAQIQDSLADAVAARTQVAAKLGQAELLLADGYITEPAENNAVSLLREVQRLDPNNPEAARMLRQAARRLAQAAQEAHAADLPEVAQLYLDLALTITPDEASWRALRDSWQAGPESGIQ